MVLGRGHSLCLLDDAKQCLWQQASRNVFIGNEAGQGKLMTFRGCLFVAKKMASCSTKDVSPSYISRENLHSVCSAPSSFSRSDRIDSLLKYASLVKYLVFIISRVGLFQTALVGVKALLLAKTDFLPTSSTNHTPVSQEQQKTPVLTGTTS